MPRLHSLQTSFVAGQLDQVSQARSETALYRNGAASLRNCEPFVAGGVRSRRGSRNLWGLSGPARLTGFTFALDQSYVAAFTHGKVDFWFASDGAHAGAVTGAPWTTAQLPELRFAQLGDVLWVAHPAFPTQEVVRTGAASWLLRPLAFDGVRATPTFRYAPSWITVQAGGGVAGSLTLSSTPTIGGSATAFWVGMRGQAREKAGPGPWRGFTVTGVSGYKLTIAWDNVGLLVGPELEVQLDGDPTVGGGGGTPGGDPSNGSGNGN